MTTKTNSNSRYGLIISTPEPKDYQFGGYSKLPRVILQENGQWDSFMVEKEHQKINVETMACAIFGTLNAGVEMLIKRKYGEELNRSDRWLAQKSGTTRQGNSPQKVCETLRVKGVPKQEDWDFTLDIKTWEEFYKEPPTELDEKAKKFIAKTGAEYSFGHEYVNLNVESIKEALQYSPVGISVYAWYRDGDIYIKPKGARDNHWCVCYGYDDEKKAWKIFDSYDSFTKLYSYDAQIMIAKRFHIERNYKQINKKQANWVVELLDEIISLINDIIKLSYGAVKKTVGAIKGAFT